MEFDLDRKRPHIVFCLKSRRAELDERWHDSLLQLFQAADENDLKFVIAVIHTGAGIGKEKKIKVVALVRIYRG